MSARVPLSVAELDELLQEQLKMLRRSAKAFDDGDGFEAKRIATVLRTLLHDTKQSRSLFGQLGKKETLFFDSAEPDSPDNILAYAPLVCVLPTLDGSTTAPRLDSFAGGRNSAIPFDAWWNAVIFRDRSERTLTRRTLVLAMANQDGGAHVDPELDETYYDMSRRASIDIYASIGGAMSPALDAHYASLRQIAHELFKTIDPSYSCTVAMRPGSAIPILMPQLVLPGRGAHVRTLMSGKFNMRRREPKVGRNEPCRCGSGAKFKRCCGK
ncbi:MAG: SEC-C domain-containing protein [Myxococcales bacterium]|nr:SEC-C domain-containing protein [Myxococcales bacterium]